MTVTVVARWRAPEGQEERAVAAARAVLESRGSQPAGRRQARVFQAIDDPATLLYVGEWTSREAFEAHQRATGAQAGDASLWGGSGYVVCERLSLFENLTYRALVIACAIVEAPAEAAEALRGLILPGGRWEGYGAPGLVQYGVYREISHDRRLVIVHGWQSPEALRAFRASRHDFMGRVRALGAQLIPFTGRELASTEV